MSILETETIDIVATKPGTQIVKLVITDHLPWDDLEQHYILLQEKINTYIAFVESGQLQRLKEPPIPTDPTVVVTVVPQFEPPQPAIEFLARVRSFLAGLGIGLEIQKSS